MSRKRHLVVTVGAVGLALTPAACGTESMTTPGQQDASSAGVDALPPPDAKPAFAIDMFGSAGSTFHFDISTAQSDKMDQGQWGGGGNGDPYQVGGDGADGTYADDLTITTLDGASKSFGKLKVWTIGQSSFRPWSGIPNIRIDTGSFQAGMKIGGVEDFRFNNGQVGGMYRETIALRLWDALGYPTPETTFNWVEAPNQWGEATRLPYSMVEVYKRAWCDREIPGGCVNMWEGVGEPYAFYDQDPCQVGDCDDTRLQQLGNQVWSTPHGPGYAAALADYIDWERFNSFQCLSWITGTGDDYIHNNNNLLVVERTDGRIEFYPYSTDISADQDWYQNVQLMGYSGEFARGCQTDPACWQDTLTRCDELLNAYDALDVNASVVQPVLDIVEANGMMRDGDADRAQFLLTWYASRSAILRTDYIWAQQPCESDVSCTGMADGRTACNGQFCVTP